METHTPSSEIKDLYGKGEQYAKTTIELVKLKAVDKTSEIAASIITRLSIILVITFFISALNIGIALLIGEALGVYSYGFLIVAGFYLLLALVCNFMLQMSIKIVISNYIIKELFN